ncbi:MAG TPA: outer membrane beta-barrel protein [Pyrinomonadaceae bacterium]|nr:outer membrane beta-barrel protein [Pyrinomonadaceae bacterium]
MKRTNKNMLFRLAFSTALLLCSALMASAQSPNPDEYPKVEIFAGYSAVGENQKPISFGNMIVPHGYAGTTGLEASLIRNFNRHLGLKADFSAHFNDETGPGNVIICNPACTTATQTIQFRSRVYNFLAGPELKGRNRTRFTPFVYALGGLGHTHARFDTPGPTFNLLLRKSTNNFAMALGGGLDLRATKRTGIRASIDYNPIFIGDSSGGRRDLIRLSLGILFH